MRKAGQIVLFEFPQADLQAGKLRPALMLRELPGTYEDWLICMISSQLRKAVPGFDEVIEVGDHDFVLSGLKTTSVIRLSRIAVIEGAMLAGSIGEISDERLNRLRNRWAAWLSGKDVQSRQ